MKKLPKILNTPARIAIAVGLAVLLTELLIMLLIENIRATMRKGHFLENVDWEFADPILLTIIIAPVLYFLIFRTLHQQAELERQIDELQRFREVTIGRELRMKELAKENAALRNSLSTKPAGDLSMTEGSTKAAPEATAHPAAGQPAEDEDSQRDALLFMLEDLENARRTIERAHQEWIVALDTVDDPIFLHDRQFRILRCNKAYQQHAGMSFKQIIGQPYYEVFPKNHGPLPSCMRTMEKAEEEEEEEEVAAGGAIYRSRAFSIHDDHGAYLHSMHILEDVTERKQMEIAIQHANRALATLGAVNRALVHASDEDELLQAICQAIVEQHGYRLAWVGYKQLDEGKSIKVMAHTGPGDYLETMRLTWAETERGMGPSGRAIRSGIMQICQDIANDPQYLPWRDEALKRGLASNIALPLKNRGGVVFGILHVYAGEANAFTSAEIDLLEEMAGDLAFGVRALGVRQERDQALLKNQQQLVQLQDSLEGTVRAIASMVEMRDPYTAGHQARVADLSAAIAEQMGLPEERVHAIHLAGLVHDLGKIQVPAEILSKPGHLSDIEYSLIKVHAQAGYDILKGIDFPWPIADMVLQHHERMDGSGYPQGLKGDAIMLEARILAVADVVEAISAHRPYRAGLGIEIALEEITRNRGRFYDPQAVDVCLALFREQGYSFRS